MQVVNMIHQFVTQRTQRQLKTLLYNLAFNPF